MGVVGVVLLAGLYSHYEFSLFIIIGSVLLLVYRPPQKNLFFLTIMIVLTVTVLFELILPGEYFSRVEILGFPLILLTLCLVGIAWIFSSTPGISTG